MKYYKLIDENTIVGVVSSNDFIRYQAFNDCFLHCDEITGEYVSYNGILYRSPWMKPIKLHQEYVTLTIVEITEEEYNIFQEAINNNETLPVIDEDVEEEIIEDEPSIEVEFVRTSKINEMSITCRHVIEAGFNFEIRGETKHFSLTTQDQLNLMSVTTMAQTQNLIPYHADGEECEFYTADEINEISAKATELKNYNLAYYNSLKTYINALETIEEISVITYGTSIPDEYKSDVLKVLEY